LTLSLEYGSGSPALTLQVNTEVSEWKTLGITTKILTVPFNSVVSDCVGNSANWSICLWGAGWIYAPDYYHQASHCTCRVPVSTSVHSAILR